MTWVRPRRRITRLSRWRSLSDLRELRIFMIDSLLQNEDVWKCGARLSSRPAQVKAWPRHFACCVVTGWNLIPRSEEHTSELQSLMHTSYAVFCLKKKKK